VNTNYQPHECDIVMEGGVTSGIVYPRFVARLARHFRLRSIGGTSVGAVAAVAAAAAQYRRNASPNGADITGFRKLNVLPRWLARKGVTGKSNLFALFQPCVALRSHYAVLQAVLNRGWVGRTVFGAGALLWHFPIGPLLGGAITAVLARKGWFASGSDIPWLTWLCAAATALGLALLFSALRFGFSARSGLSKNRCGICSGMPADGSSAPALTAWLHGLVQDMAGLPHDRPLTFGDLEQSNPSIELAFMTTGLSELRAHRLPHASKGLLFRRSEMAQLFPPAVVAALVVNAVPLTKGGSKEVVRRYDSHIDTPEQDLYRLPAAKDLPIVFGARLSLSFPLLLQAVPLYRVRYMETDGVTPGRVDLKRIWLSDGGLTSNFPIHFFDSLLPERPTFGISLDNSLAANAPRDKRVVLAQNNMQGLTASYHDVDDAEGDPSMLKFAFGIVRTIRCWRDEALRRAPGYRDRVVRVRHTKDEGGLNLDMPAQSVRAMSSSGAAAADAIIARFVSSTAAQNGWLNHRIVRMRSTTAMLQQTLRTVTAAWQATSQAPTYPQLWTGATPGLPVAYALSGVQNSTGIGFWNGLTQMVVQTNTDFSNGAPKPRATLEVTPPQW
jgi:predicted acylesterase/phospholipase RssA